MEVKDVQTPEKYFSVVYDIRRPYDSFYQTLLRKEKEGTLTPVEAQELKRRRKQASTIDNFVNALKRYGVRINWSVFVFPTKNRERVEEVLKKYKAKFDLLGIHYDIYTLEYAPSSNFTIEQKVLLHLKLTVERVVRKLEKAKSNSEKKAYYDELKHLVDLSEVFGMKEELLKFTQEKLKEARLPPLTYQKKLGGA